MTVWEAPISSGEVTGDLRPFRAPLLLTGRVTQEDKL